MMSRPFGIFILLLAVIASSVGVVYAKHQGRKLFIELQSLAAERDRMDVEWGQLQLEQGTLSTHGQIERAARERLGMVIPAAGSLVMIKP
jgi:cell division protein FtsL